MSDNTSNPTTAPAKRKARKASSKGKARVRTMKVHTASNRPTAGRMLFAHTLAVLDLLGMLKTKPEQRKAVRPGALQTLMGATAVRHHTRSTGAFGRDDDGRVTLTDTGLRLFAGRAGRLGIEQRTDQIAEGPIVKEMIAALRSGGTVQGIRFDDEKEIAIG